MSARNARGLALPCSLARCCIPISIITAHKDPQGQQSALAGTEFRILGLEQKKSLWYPTGWLQGLVRYALPCIIRALITTPCPCDSGTSQS